MHADTDVIVERRLRIAQRLALFLIRGYQLVLSPMFAGWCRFTPSCSTYAAEAIARFGLLKGTWLAVRRLSRCHPFGAHGVDPVPARVPGRRWGGRPQKSVS